MHSSCNVEAERNRITSRGTGWFEAISDAWQEFKRVYCNVLKVEDDFAFKEMQSSFAEVAGGGNSRLSAKVRRATVNSLKRKEEEAGGDSVKWA